VHSWLNRMVDIASDPTWKYWVSHLPTPFSVGHAPHLFNREDIEHFRLLFSELGQRVEAELVLPWDVHIFSEGDRIEVFESLPEAHAYIQKLLDNLVPTFTESNAFQFADWGHRFPFLKLPPVLEEFRVAQMRKGLGQHIASLEAGVAKAREELNELGPQNKE